MNEQFQIEAATATPLFYYGRPLGTLREQPSGPPIFEVIQWDEYALNVLMHEAAALRSPVRARATLIAEAAADAWEIRIKDIFARARTREISDARAASAHLLHQIFPHIKDRVVAAAFGRERTWALHCYKLTEDQLETSVPFRAKYETTKRAVLPKFWNQSEPQTLKAP